MNVIQFPKKTTGEVLEKGELKIYPAEKRVVGLGVGGEAEINLTPIEFKILFFLASNEESVYSREQLVTNVWGENARVVGRTVDKHICSLRAKLGYWGEHIQTVSGMGYRFIPASYFSKAA